MTELETLQAENKRLKADLTSLQEEHKLVVKTIIKTLQCVGLWPITEDDSVMKKALLAVKDIMFQSMTSPKELEKRFEFMKDVYPLCEKYKDFKIE